MTDYEKKYNEALERARQIKDGKDEWRYSDLAEITPALTEIFSELRESESEDERNIDTIFNCLYQCCDSGFISGTQRDNALAWLEKQKEQKPPVDVDPCDASWDAYYQRGLNKGYELGLEAGMKEQKPISQEDFDKAKHEALRGEQKPVDDSDFKTKLAEYMMKNRTGYSYNISSESILQMAKEELIKRGELKEQKPAWSEEHIMKEAVKWLVDDDYDELTDKGRFILGSAGIGYNGYYIPYSDLLKLPKDD